MGFRVSGSGRSRFQPGPGFVSRVSGVGFRIEVLGSGVSGSGRSRFHLVRRGARFQKMAKYDRCTPFGKVGMKVGVSNSRGARPIH